MNRFIHTGRMAGLIAIWVWIAIPQVRAQTLECTSQLMQAEHHYMYGRFDDAVGSLQPCLETNGFTQHEQRRAYRLLGLSYLCWDRSEEARTAIQNLMTVDPAYKIDPVQDPPMFATLVEDVSAQHRLDQQETLPLQMLGYQAPDLPVPFEEHRSLVMRPYERPVQDLMYDLPAQQERGWIKWALAGIVAGSVLTGVLLNTVGTNTAADATTDVAVVASTTNVGNGGTGANGGNGGNGNRGPGPNPPPR